jgi:transposase
MTSVAIITKPVAGSGADSDLVRLLFAELASLRREVAELRQQVGYWKAQHARALEREERLEAENEQLRAEVRELRSQLFGRRSEKASTKDRSNQLDGEELETPSPPRRRGQQPDRPGPQRRDHSHLPVCEERQDLPADQQVCPKCQAPLVANGTEESETLEIEVQAYRRRVQRQRYQRTCTCKNCPKTFVAPAPAQLIPKGSLGLSIWVEVLLAKFLTQQPLERLLQEWQLLGLDLPAGTVTGGLQKLTSLFEPLYQLLCERNRTSNLMQADETRWMVFVAQEGKTGHQWWLWLFVGVDSVCFILDPRRSHDVPENHLREGNTATLLVDRYSAYKAIDLVKNEHIQLAFCWAHVRRDFIKVGKSYPALKDWALTWLGAIRDLYRRQRQRLALRAGSPQRALVEAELRQNLMEMHRRAEQELAQPQPRLPCQKVLQSLLEHWPGLTRFLDDPRIALDNNAAERLHRNPVVGRKNYYGSGALWSGSLAAMLFSLFATLQRWGINPRRWLSWYLQSCACQGGHAPANPAAFMPWNLTDEQKQWLGSATPDSS